MELGYFTGPFHISTWPDPSSQPSAPLYGKAPEQARIDLHERSPKLVEDATPMSHGHVAIHYPLGIAFQLLFSKELQLPSPETKLTKRRLQEELLVGLGNGERRQIQAGSSPRKPTVFNLLRL